MGAEELDGLDPELVLIRVTAELWRRGNLRYKRHATQLKIRWAIDASPQRKFFLLCSRRLGKTFELLLGAFELAIRKPGSRILYLAAWAKDAAEISSDLAAKILEDCPPDLKPKFNAQAKEFTFSNGSIVRLKGVNGEHAQFLRGGAYDLVVMDECGLMDDLAHVLSDIVMPMTLTTGGRILLASTPPRSPGHASAKIFEDLARVDAVAVFTLRDAPHVADETKLEFLIEAGEPPEKVAEILRGDISPNGTTARREYFCEFVSDADSAVLPEFPRAEREIVLETVRPPFFDAYVAMDPGFRDRTGIIFAYWDFLQAKLVIEDELLLEHPNTLDIANALRTKEKGLWKEKEPYLRVSDVDLRLIADLQQMHSIKFMTTRKENRLDAVNLVRNMIQSRSIVINPRCKNLVRQMKNAIWNHKATDFDRPEQGSIDGHFDEVAALIYLCRNVNRTRNPYPDYWFQLGGPGGPPPGSWISPKNQHSRRRGLMPDTPLGKKLAKRAGRSRLDVRTRSC